MTTRFYRLSPLALAVIGVTACSSGGDTAAPSLMTQGEVDNAAAEMVHAFTLPVTHFSLIPSIGSAEYRGHSWIEVTGADPGFLIGDMTANVNFASRAISGSVNNVSFVDPGNNPVQPLSGALTLDGTLAVTGSYSATGTGTLTSVGPGPLTGSTTANLTYSGNFRRGDLPADHLYGTISGTLTGSMGVAHGTGSNFYGVVQP